jgi:Fe-S-cluster containining protein
MENKKSQEKGEADMKEVLELLPQKARDKEKENRAFFRRLKKKPPRDLDETMQDLHRAEFERTDCLRCAHCCKTTGPLFTRADVERISRHLKMKASKFEADYLRTDEEGDLVLQAVPCPFLGADNYCGIYEVRPKACREYPHTDRRRFEQLGKLTLTNTFICPAAFNIVEEMKKRIKV